MWLVVLTGVFGVLTLLVKAAVDMGSRTTRRRRNLTADLELLAKLHETLPNASGVVDLEDRIDRQLIEFALDDLAPPAASKASTDRPMARDETRAREIARSFSGLIALVAAIAAGTLASGLWEWASDATGKINGDTWASVAGVVAAAIGVGVTFVTSTSLRRHEISLEEYEELVKRARRLPPT